ncbi:flagellar hook-associated protein FlgK [Parvularcula maris]|uniref:Flagellar hook-associated protein 1 n=1 Tax=Parvularcula maris TaxID=2965077 RepID=A0A9X2L8H3_9PROT|nr:flagellar hook-associated protein FlgK [Parvularcula maris]MCQ8184918.1 flagellar hook-associated protein FlgK [Parvularcula maris]
MSFSTIMTNALAGMNASSVRAEVLSYNIANAETEGYARRQARFEPSSPGAVQLTAIQRADAGVARRELLGAETESAGARIRSQALAAMNQALGDADDPNALYAVYARFETALADLRLTPESGAMQLAFLRAGQDLTESFAQLEGSIQDIRETAEAEIARDVLRANEVLRELQGLNAEAVQPRGPGLEDISERQSRLLTELSQLLDVEVQGETGEEIRIRTGGGFLLLGDTAQELSFTRSGALSADLTYAGGSLSGLTLGGYNLTPGKLQGLRGGRIAANFAVRDSLATDVSGRIDAAATALADRLGADPATAVIVVNAGPGSAAQRLSVNPLVDPEQGGELYRLRDGVTAGAPGPAGGQGMLAELEAALSSPQPLPIATGTPSPLTYTDTLGSLATQLGTMTLRAQDASQAAERSRQSFADETARLTGVDTDRELQDLLLVEQSFAANARVVQAADEMLQRLLEI